MHIHRFVLLFSAGLFIMFCTALHAQQKAMSFTDAAAAGIRVSELDSVYTSAVHTDKSKAVFRSKKMQRKMAAAYTGMLTDLGQFLHKNGFRWEKQTRCFNRIYFSPEGKIEYFLFDFGGKPEDRPSAEKQAEFTGLLRLFIQDFRLPLSAPVKFAQCSPVVYNP